MPQRILTPTRNNVVNLSLDTIERGKQALVFVNSKRSAEKEAEETAKARKGMRELTGLAEDVLKVLSSPTKQCRRLARCMKRGVAFHHAGLPQKQKEIIEDNFRKGTIKIIAATPTLAAGVDLPAFRAIIRDLRRFAGPRGMAFIPVLEYLQMAGRAGRPSYDDHGEAIILASTEKEAEVAVEQFIHGEPEEIYSKLAVEPVLRTYLLSLIAGGFVKDHKTVMDFFSRTLWAHQFEDMPQLEVIIDRMLMLLEGWGFITQGGEGEFTPATDMGRINATTIGARVAQLYLDPLTAHKLITNLQRDVGVDAFNLLHAVSYTLEMRPRLRVKTKDFDHVQMRLNKAELLDLEPGPYESEHDEFLNATKTALALEGWIQERTEEWLLEQYDCRPGELNAKRDIADWLLYAMAELAVLVDEKDTVKHINRLRYRLKYGVKEELLALLKLKNVGRVRARRMFRNGIKDLGDVKSADVALLARILGKRVAADIKSQVGQEVDVEALPERRDEGQQRLQSFAGK